MYDLFTFYRSREWQALCAQIKQERVNEDGQLICAYCGKPIVKAYDCICHHKKHLTEENVNDFSVSLNPENVDLVHHRCHNYIHDKLGYSKREVFIVYGPPLAGKTTWVRENMSEGDLVIDIDSIWECISGTDRYVKPNTLKPIVFKIRDLLLDSVKYRLGRWNNAYIIGSYVYQSDRERVIKDLGAKEIYINTPMIECINRLNNLDDKRDHDEWLKYIQEWFEKYSGD